MGECGVSNFIAASRPGQIFCFLEKFDESCPVGEAVHILSARLGRTERNRCTNSDAHLGCADDVSAQLREKCYGQQRCEFFVSTLGEMIQTCPRSYIPYLHVDHECRIGTGTGKVEGVDVEVMEV